MPETLSPAALNALLAFSAPAVAISAVWLDEDDTAPATRSLAELSASVARSRIEPAASRASCIVVRAISLASETLSRTWAIVWLVASRAAVERDRANPAPISSNGAGIARIMFQTG